MAERSAEQQIKDAVWQYTGWAVLILGTFLAGVAVAYIFWGDAPELRGQVADLGQKVHAARAERENLSVQKNRAEHYSAKCQEELQTLKASAAAEGPDAADAAAQ